MSERSHNLGKKPNKLNDHRGHERYYIGDAEVAPILNRAIFHRPEVLVKSNADSTNSIDANNSIDGSLVNLINEVDITDSLIDQMIDIDLLSEAEAKDIRLIGQDLSTDNQVRNSNDNEDNSMVISEVCSDFNNWGRFSVQIGIINSEKNVDWHRTELMYLFHVAEDSKFTGSVVYSSINSYFQQDRTDIYSNAYPGFMKHNLYGPLYLSQRNLNSGVEVLQVLSKE